ncbi:MAG: hypothetical protein A2504_06910 [Bdellovibrionales bacterium RIFOXYD12_FULL_39_22]|nr:MAG: hypothetical protein A2385_09230 [Bdellovibrionales bacterium RIFOXYB1_FULL_39_21]OFZ45120.1 MAG: hypothetical protein A2485_05310 [Bdellovibrionales bacterium RIFOXYC12_FULL_39_17]OFZ45688.1 MAG: hypothetical protein A2404_03810 [Bdellovibrionales bacterium RIFOXYC1_FULL_39_130]OFZ72657.1 MAG: hypothetical protein A2451_14305 [Bdellovibrionales bacterium RIFOXYC2_FULL_39_8]OFZ77550.1 MAG: hypothetical protein A2560_09395 [Bdellovibrionales bacterium RIFOXYD1_FULL_39_84]OFZ91679.1 MAG:
MKILLIEDEILIQKSLKKILERAGATVSVSSSGKEAILLINQGSFDRIICDIMLQDITGFDVIEESKRKYETEEIKKIFILMTAYTSPQVIDAASKYGCKIVSKPFDDLEKIMNIFMSTND